MIYNADLIPRAADAGVGAVIRSLSYETIEDMPEFLARMNSQITPLRMTLAPLLQFLADMHAEGNLQDVAYDGDLPDAIARPGAPAGIGADAGGVWFGTPDTGTAFVRWYVNGALAAREERDLSANRYMALADIGATAGDVVQIAIENGGVIGWWGRVSA